MDARIVPGDEGFEDEDSFPFTIEDIENHAVCLPLATSRGAVLYADEFLTPGLMRQLATLLHAQADREEGELRRIVDGC